MGKRDIIEGPAVISFSGHNYYTEGSITLSPDFKPRTLSSSYFGPADRRVTDKLFSLSFTPCGMMDDNALKYFPWDIDDVGSLLAPSSDLAVEIYASSGVKLSFPAGVIISPPQLLLGTDRGPFGSMTIACMGDLTKVDAAADAHYTIASAAISAHTLDWSAVRTPAYKLVLGGDTPTTIDGLEGFTLDLRASVTPRMVNRYGTVNFKLSAVDPVITFAPAYQTESEMLALLNIQGTSAAQLGGSLSLGRSLTLSPAESGALGITVVFADCCVESGSMIFGADDPRHGDYAIVPVLSSGSDLYTITFPDLTPAE